MGYTAEPEEEDIAKAIGKELPISTKKSVEVCRALRGMNVEDAKELLEEVIEKKRVIPYRKYRRTVSHKKGGVAGGYPVRVAKAILKVLEDAQSNAEMNELDPEAMRIEVIAAHRGRRTEGFKPRARGRSTKWDKETINIEVILRSEEE
ncbi:MAG: 50S ribosomal protein L22 [Thermoplasmata archaeon]